MSLRNQPLLSLYTRLVHFYPLGVSVAWWPIGEEALKPLIYDTWWVYLSTLLSTTHTYTLFLIFTASHVQLPLDAGCKRCIGSPTVDSLIYHFPSSPDLPLTLSLSHHPLHLQSIPISLYNSPAPPPPPPALSVFSWHVMVALVCSLPLPLFLLTDADPTGACPH